MREPNTFNGENEIKDMKKIPQKIHNGNRKNLTIIVSGYDDISIKFLSELICIGKDIFNDRIDLIIPHDPSANVIFPGEKIKVHIIKDFSEKQKSEMNPFLILINHFLIELKTAYLLSKGDKSDIYLFFLCQSKIIPLLTLKLQHKKSVLMLGASFSELYRAHKNFRLKIFSLIEKIDFILADKLIIYSPVLISGWHLESYRHKILIAHEHFLDFHSFRENTPLSSRPALIGYLGRLSTEKGVQHFVRSIPAILDAYTEYNVLIGGDGPLKDYLSAAMETDGLTARVDLHGWIPHDELPRYLNRIRLLVLPSYTEGLPNIMLEAMACGTPVLATPVGAIPEIIKDGKTGFIMESNSPECIAENVQRALDRPDLAIIANNGRLLVQDRFSFEKTVGDWKKIVDSI